MAEKHFLGAKLRKLREARGWTLEACAERLGLSPSYLSQLETNQRPATARVLIALTRAFHVDAGLFDLEGDARLVADLRAASADLAGEAEPPTAAELKQVVASSPRLARQFVTLHQNFRDLNSQPRTPDFTAHQDQAADLFYRHHNHFEILDTAAEALAAALPRTGLNTRTLEAALNDLHGVRVLYAPDHHAPAALSLNSRQPETGRAFQMARRLALLSFHDLIEAERDQDGTEARTMRKTAHEALLDYAADALLMPYGDFLQTARDEKHDIERLASRFQVSFEQVCRRLTTLQRPGARGLPFYFAQVDMAGNIARRFNTPQFPLSSSSSACPLWKAHDFGFTPDRIDARLVETQNGSRLLSVVKLMTEPGDGYLARTRRYGLSLAWEAADAGAVVYATGLDLKGPAPRTDGY